MNKYGRKELTEIRNEIDKLCADLYKLMERVEVLQDDEQAKYDNLTDVLQETERGQAIRNCADLLSDLKDNLEYARDNLDDAYNNDIFDL